VVGKKHAFTNQNRCTTTQNKHKKLKPGLVAYKHYWQSIQLLCVVQCICGNQGVWWPLDLLAVFSATAGNFNAKFYPLIYSSCTYMHISATVS